VCVCGGGGTVYSVQCGRKWMFGWSESEEDELKLWWERSEYARTWHLTAALKFQWRLRRGYFETISEPALVPNRCWDQRMELFSNLINSKINRN
jgi:hypothetical protein